MWCALGFRQQLDRIEKGEFRAYWTYTDAQWKDFIDDEREVSDSIVSGTMFVLGVIGLIVGISGIGIIGVGNGMLITIGATAAGYPLGHLFRQIRRRKLARWAREPWFAIIGHEGLYYGEKYLPWSTFGSGLDSLKTEKKDEMLYLVFTYYTQSKDGRHYHDHRIPVPYGKENEAYEIAG